MANADRVRELLDYCPDTGQFTWKIHVANRKAGTAAGSRHNEGYVSIKVDGKQFLAHRLAWLHVHGSWPSTKLDHKNRNRADNRLENLRPASNNQNSYNAATPRTNTSGTKGVHWHAPYGKWVARVRAEGREIFLGAFKDKADAVKIVEAARNEFHKEFALI